MESLIKMEVLSYSLYALRAVLAGCALSAYVKKRFKDNRTSAKRKTIRLPEVARQAAGR